MSTSSRHWIIVVLLFLVFLQLITVHGKPPPDTTGTASTHRILFSPCMLLPYRVLCQSPSRTSANYGDLDDVVWGPRDDINFTYGIGIVFIYVIGSSSMDGNFTTLIVSGQIYINTFDPIDNFLTQAAQTRASAGGMIYDRDYQAYYIGNYYGSPTGYSDYFARIDAAYYQPGYCSYSVVYHRRVYEVTQNTDIEFTFTIFESLGLST